MLTSAQDQAGFEKWAQENGYGDVVKNMAGMKLPSLEDMMKFVESTVWFAFVCVFFKHFRAILFSLSRGNVPSIQSNMDAEISKLAAK